MKGLYAKGIMNLAVLVKQILAVCAQELKFKNTFSLINMNFIRYSEDLMNWAAEV
jgi:hypothetical protein